MCKVNIIRAYVIELNASQNSFIVQTPDECLYFSASLNHIMIFWQLVNKSVYVTMIYLSIHLFIKTNALFDLCNICHYFLKIKLKCRFRHT
jgi:hypothetical protein